MSVTTISGSSPPSWPKKTSIMCRESRTVPDTTLAPRPIALVVDHVQPRHAPLGPEVLPVGPGERGRDRDDEPHPVDRGDQAAAQRLGERDARLRGRPAGRWRRPGVSGRTGSSGRRATSRAALQRRDALLGDRAVADVQGVGGQARGDRDVQVVQPGPAAGDGGERRRELRHPAHHLQDHLGQVDAGQHGRDPAAQVDQRRRAPRSP